MRRALAWAIAVPVAAAATVAAHALDYRLVVPDAGARRALLAATGHAYGEWTTVALSIAGAAALVLAGDALAGRRRGPAPSARAFLLVPPLAFVLQEHAERIPHDGTIPWGAILEPTFLPGLLLTVPFGAAAFVAARLLLRVARALARVVAPPPRALGVLAPAVPALDLELPRLSVLATRAPTRGPPAARRA
jgi:hypothetical protein